jgi:phytoene dehydrogenase-like protein
MKNIVIFGAGVAGLSAAHEFLRLGYQVTVYEANHDAGGFFRSARMPKDYGMPSEYSWHGFGPWYHNVFDIMKQIPFDENGSVYDKSLSRPVNYGIVSDKATESNAERVIFSMFLRFRMTKWDTVKWAKLLFKTWTANRRTKEYYSALNASEQFQPIMSDLGWKTWRATFGPWVGCDWTRASLHHVGQFFRRNLMTKPNHYHQADEQGPEWTHGPGGGWLLLRGPSNEFWFDKWVAYLQDNGVRIFFQKSLKRFDFDGKNITAAHLESGEEIHADVYILAINPFASLDVLEQTPELAKLDQLRKFRPLIGDGPHTQVSFRIAFSDKIAWPKERSALLLPDSEFNPNSAIGIII